MEKELRIRCSDGFKQDVQSFANRQNMSLSEYTREALRRQMQRDLQDQ
jgi:hypothetical protein